MLIGADNFFELLRDEVGAVRMSILPGEHIIIVLISTSEKDTVGILLLPELFKLSFDLGSQRIAAVTGFGLGTILVLCLYQSRKSGTPSRQGRT